MDIRKAKWSRPFALCAVVLILGWLDWLTGYELNFFVFYFLPVSAAAWLLGLGASVAAAVLSALVWFAANDLAGYEHAAPFFAVWNTGIRLVAFLSIGWAVSRMQALLAREQTTSAALRQALSEIKVLQAFLPICAQCKKIRNEQGSWEQLESYISARVDTQFSHSYCPECAKKTLAEAGLALKKEPGA